MKTTLARSAVLTAVLLFAFALAAAAAPAPQPFAPVQGGYVASAETVLPWAPDRILVKFTPEALASSPLAANKGRKDIVAKSTSLPSLDALLAEVGATGIRAAFRQPAAKAMADELGTGRWFMVDLGAGADVPAVAARLATDPGLEFALPDLRAFPSVAPNDPLYPNNWGHDNTAQLPDLDWGGTYDHTLPTTVGTPGFDTDADLAWNGSQGFGSSSVVIAILDSGVEAGHPDLNQMAGYDFGDGDSNPDDNSAQAGHGTACAGVAAGIADNGVGVAGVAGGCTIMPVKVADSGGSLFFSYIVDGVYHAADNGADIISMSFGASTTAYAPMDAAITYAWNAGVTLLAATGNNNGGTIHYPAYNLRVIGVGAASPCGERKRSSSSSGEVNPGVSTDPNGYTCDGERWWGSNYGVNIQDHQGAVDVIAPTILPTTDILGAGGYDPTNYSKFFNGTSCATPYAAGVCALIKSKNPGFTPTQVWDQLTATAMDVVSVESGAGWDRYTGYGMVNASDAVGGGVSAPVANFSASTASGCLPLLVDFTDLSTGTVDTWSWTFGDGGTSSAPSPSHSYTAAGLYTVSLTVSGPGGADVLTLTDLIQVDGPPTAAFSAAPTTVLVGDPVAFTDLSTDATARLWSFGDGNTSTLANPSHAYAAAGLYTVSLLVSNGCGDDTMTSVDLISVVAPAINVAVSPVDPGIGTVSLYSRPDGAGDPLSAAQDWDGVVGNAPAIVDATIKVVLTDAFGAPVVGFPAAGITVQSSAGGWNQCEPLAADGPTDASGTTTISGALFAGGSSASGELLQVVVDDPAVGAITYPGGLAGLDYRVNSSDINGDLAANLIDVPLFATAFHGGTYVYGADFFWTGSINLTDVTLIASGLGAVCPAKVAADQVAVGGRMGVLFDDEGLRPSRDLAPGRQVEAWVVLEGDAAARGISACEFTLRASDNVEIHAVETVGGGLDLGSDRTVIVGWAAPRAATGNAPLKLARVQLSVTDELPAHLWLEAGRAAGLDEPAVVVDGGMLRAAPVSGDVADPVASLNDKDFSLEGDTPLVRKLAMAVAPNPFNPRTEIRFALPADGDVQLQVFDARGTLVATLIDGSLGAGEHTAVWNGTDRHGRHVASGVYFSSLRTDSGRVMQKMLLMK